MPDPISGVSTGSTLLDVIIAFATVWGGKGVGSLAMRRFSNGFSQKIQPITRNDLREELAPLIDVTRETAEAVKEHNAYMQGRMNAGRGSSE